MTIPLVVFPEEEQVPAHCIEYEPGILVETESGFTITDERYEHGKEATMSEQSGESEFDFWAERLGIACGGYNTAVDSEMLAVAKLIVEAREQKTDCFVTSIAKQLGLIETHVELVQYILASVRYDDERRPGYAVCPFTYGTSPRGLFVDDLATAKRFVAEFEKSIGE